MNKLIPDFDLNTGKLKVKIITQSYPETSTTDQITKDFEITNVTNKVNFRARGRQAKIRVSCNSQGSSWQWGAVRLGFQGDGER